MTILIAYRFGVAWALQPENEQKLLTLSTVGPSILELYVWSETTNSATVDSTKISSIGQRVLNFLRICINGVTRKFSPGCGRVQSTARLSLSSKTFFAVLNIVIANGSGCYFVFH